MTGQCEKSTHGRSGINREIRYETTWDTTHGETGARLSAVLFSLFATLAMAGINPHHWLLDYLHACAENAGEAPANLDPWLPWAIDDARLERLRHPYPVQPHGP